MTAKSKVVLGKKKQQKNKGWERLTNANGRSRMVDNFLYDQIWVHVGWHNVLNYPISVPPNQCVRNNPGPAVRFGCSGSCVELREKSLSIFIQALWPNNVENCKARKGENLTVAPYCKQPGCQLTLYIKDSLDNFDQLWPWPTSFRHHNAFWFFQWQFKWSMCKRICYCCSTPRETFVDNIILFGNTFQWH